MVKLKLDIMLCERPLYDDHGQPYNILLDPLHLCLSKSVALVQVITIGCARHHIQ